MLMTVSIKQEDNLGYCHVLDYAEQYHLDTVVIIWRTEDRRPGDHGARDSGEADEPR